MAMGMFRGRRSRTGATARPGIVLTLLFLAAAAGGQDSWQDVNQAAREARAAKDYAKYRQHVLRLAELMSGHPDTLIGLARAETQLGNSAAALEALRTYAAMGLVRDLSTEPELEPLRQDPAYAAVLQQLERNARPVAGGALAFTLPEADLIAEDIAHDAAGGRFLISSVRKRKILAVTPDGRATDFVSEGKDGVWGIVGLAVDARRSVLWATTAAMPQAQGVPEAERGRTALLRYTLPDGRLTQRHDLSVQAAEAVLGDLTLGPGGEVYVSDSSGGGVYVLRPGSEALQALVPPGTLASPQGLALAPDGRRLIVADYLRGLAVVDLDGGQVGWLEHPRDVAVNGIDGLYRVEGGLLAVQNGTSPKRLLHLTLDPQYRRIQGARVLEAATPGLGEPTHGVLAQGQFWFIANSGWDRVSRDGSVQPGDPPAVWTVALP
jgi:sugar lactone lactonase YvrE